MAQIPSIFNKNIQKAHEWLLAIMENLDLQEDEEDKALALLRATLHELRDNIPLNNMAKLSTQLPLIIKGVFFESWNPEHILLKERKKIDFLEGVAARLPASYQDIRVEKAVRAVFKALAGKVDNDEIEKIKKVLSYDVRELMP